MPEVTTAPATPDRWDDLVAVFGTRGDPSRCWCQWFMRPGQEASAADAPANRSALQSQVENGPPPGVLAYVDDAPAGWCAVAPRPAYPRLARSQVLRGTPPEDLEDPDVWAVTCFVVPVGRRRRGIARHLLDGAVAHAAAGGPAVVEAYPVDVDARARVSTAELYHGPLSLFLAAGFHEVARPTPTRAVVRRSVPCPA